MAVTSLNFLRAIYYVFEGPIWGLKNWKATGQIFFFFFNFEYIYVKLVFFFDPSRFIIRIMRR